MMRQQVKNIGFWTLGLLICSISGCGFSFFSNDGVLKGTWQLATPTDSGLGQTYLTFNSSGDLTRVQVAVGPVTEIYTDFSSQNVNVSGTAVTIEAAFSGNTMKFEGTLNDDYTQAIGTLYTIINLNSGIVLEGQPARIIKQ
jgi:hypothetical protein